jgi:hypothetical protein
MDNLNDFVANGFASIVTILAAILGIVIIWIGINRIRKATDAVPEKWPIIGILAVGAFLLIGTQYKSFKVSATGLEAIRNDVAAAADAAAEVATQAEHAASVAQETQNQVSNLTTALEQGRVLSPAATNSIRSRLQSTPPIDFKKLQNARSVLTRIRQK